MSALSVQNSNYEKLLINEYLVLCAVGIDEVNALYKITDLGRDYLAKYLPWAAKNTLEDSLGFIQKTKQDRLTGAEYGFGIYYDDVLAGHISLMHLSDEQKPEIGYWIAQNASGKGVTSLAAERVTRFGFETLGLDEILIKAAITNTASNKIAEKLGYELYTTEKSDNETDINVWRKTNE